MQRYCQKPPECGKRAHRERPGAFAMAVHAAAGGVVAGDLNAIACATSQIQFELIECHVTILTIK
jgi:hypothetical protein